MVSYKNADSVLKTENNLISTNQRQKCHRWWSLMDLFKNICFFYDFIKTGLFSNRKKTRNNDGISDFFKRTTKKKQQKRRLLVPLTQSKTLRKKYTKRLVTDLPKLSYLEKSCCYFVDHYQVKAKLIKRSKTFINNVWLREKQKVSENVLRCVSDINNNNNSRTKIISYYSADCNEHSLHSLSKNVRRWLFNRNNNVLLTKSYCTISLRNKEISFQLIIEFNPMGVHFSYFCVPTLPTVNNFDVYKIRKKYFSCCRYTIPTSLLKNSIGKNELRETKIKCLIYDTIYKFAVQKMEDTGATATILQQQQLHLAPPIYSAIKTIANITINEEPIATKSRVSSAISDDIKKSLTWWETMKTDATNGNDDYYYQDALKRYRIGGTETLKRVNAEMSKTLKDGVGTLNNINIRVREYLNEMECTGKMLKSKTNINRQIEYGSQGDEHNINFSEKEDDAMVSDKKRRIPTKSTINENKEVHEIIEIDKILKTEMENQPVSLGNFLQVMRHIDNINEYRNDVINHNDKTNNKDDDDVDRDQNQQMTEMTEKKLEKDGNINIKVEKEEITDETFEFAKGINSQPQDVGGQIKSLDYKSDDDGDGRSTPEILEGDEKNKDRTCRLTKEKKKRKIKIITKKSMLSNTTIIEVQSPKTCNKTREEKLEELIKALSKKSGDERIRQIMEFLQEQTVSSKPFQSDLVEDIPRIRALTNIHGRLKQEELARDSLFEFQKKMCVAKKVKARIKLPTSLGLTRTTLQENKKKLVHLRAQELYVPDRHINRLTKTTTPSDSKKDKDISKLSPSEAHVRPKGRIAKYLEKRRKRLIQNALNYKRSHHSSSAVAQQSKTATITMPKDAISIRKTLEKKASSKSDNSDRIKSTLQLNINEKLDLSNSNNNTKENNSNNPSKIELSINGKSGTGPGSTTVAVRDSKTNKTNQKFYDLKENPDYSRNPVEDYARDKHKWLRHKSDSPKSSKNSLYCFDILDEITPNDVQPLKSEYPRRDNILPEKIPHPCESFLGKLINRGNRKVLEALLKVETPKIVCSSPNCITCRTKDNHVGGKRSKVYNKNSASSERSFSSTDETPSVKKKKNHILIVPKSAKKDNAAKTKITTATVENGNEFRFKNFLKGRELAFSNNGPVAKAKSAGFEGAKKERLRKIHSDRSRTSSQRAKLHKPKNVKLNVPKGLGHSNDSTRHKKNVDNFTRQQVEEKLKQYMVDPYLQYPTTVTIMPVSVVYHTFDNTNGNPRMMSHSTARVPFVQQPQRQQREDHTKNCQEKSSLSLDQNPSYIFTSTSQGGEISNYQNQQKNLESAQLMEFLREQNKNDVSTGRSRKGAAVTRESFFDKSQCRNRKCTSVTKMEQQPLATKIKNKKSMLNQENAEAGFILPKMICKRAGVKSAPSKHQFKGKTQKKFSRLPTENNAMPLKKVKDKSRNVHLKDDIQKVIQSVEFKMVDILSDPRKHNVDAFMDVEKEITNVLAKFKTHDKTIEEEDGTITSMVDDDHKMKEMISFKRSCLMPDVSGSNSTTPDAALSSLSVTSKKERQVLTDICTMVKKTSPRKRMTAGIVEKNQVPKITSISETTTRPDTSPSYLESVESSNKDKDGKVSFDRTIAEKIITNTSTHAKHNMFKTSPTSNEEKIEPIRFFYSQTKPRSKGGPTTNLGSTLPSSSSSFLPQHSLVPHNLRRRKSQTVTCLRTFSPPSRAFIQLSSRSRPFSVATTKVGDETTHYSNKTETTDDNNINININNAFKSKRNWKNGKDIDIPLQPKCEIEKVRAETNIIGVEMMNVCEGEMTVKKSGGSGDKQDIVSVFRDQSEARFLDNNAETINRLNEKDSKAVLEDENEKSTVIDARKSWTDTDLTSYTDSFHVTSNSASFNVTQHTTVANLEDTNNGPVIEEKCFITAAYEPKPRLSEKIDATLAKIEAATKTIEKAMLNDDNSLDASIGIAQEVETAASEKERSPVDYSETFYEKSHVNENIITNLENEECETAKREDGNIVCRDNIIYFLDNLTSLTAESNNPLPITVARRKFTALNTLLHICLVYHKTTIFYCIDIYHQVYLTSKCLNSNYQQEILQLLDHTAEIYDRNEYIYDIGDIMEEQLLLHSQNRRFERHSKLRNSKEKEKSAKNYMYKARILDFFYGLLFTLLYFGLIFNYVCHFIE